MLQRLIALSLVGALSLAGCAPRAFSPPLSMELTSSAFSDNGELPVEYTCDGQGINPPLSIAGVPAEAKSLVLIVEDPDAPSGSFIHWVLWNMPPSTAAVPGGAVPQGATEGMTSAGSTEFVPACPPSGTHRYFFRLYALDALLQFASAPTASQLQSAMEGHVLATGVLVGLYHRI